MLPSNYQCHLLQAFECVVKACRLGVKNRGRERTTSVATSELLQVGCYQGNDLLWKVREMSETMDYKLSTNNKTKTDKVRRVLFFSSVKDVNLLKITGFYSTDINILSDLGYKVQLSCSFIDFFKFWQYDIAFIYFWSKGLIPAIISKIFFKKVLFTGGIDRLDRNYNKSKVDYIIRKIVFKLCTINSDANIIVSKSDINNIKETGYKVKRIHYLPHVIDLEKYAYHGSPKKDLITTVVWMEAEENVIRKGVDKLLYVYKEYLKLNKDLTIQIIGSVGEGTNYLKNIAKDLDIEDRIIFTGRISEEDKIRCLKESKYYFQLSLYEGFGIAALEALATGNIVFHSGRGGLADAIDSFGILIEDIDDYNNIALKLNEINNNYENYSDFICKGVKHVSDNFSYDVRRDGILNIINGIYRSALTQPL